MTEYVVFRFVNVFYYLVFLTFIILYLAYVFPKRKEQPYKNSFIIFLSTSIVLCAMEFYGTFSGIREFYIGGERNIIIQLILQLIMGFGEGGAWTGVMYLMVEAIYKKDWKRYTLFLLSMAVIMLTFSSFTMLYGL